jgi:hypothetical protein
VYYFKFQRLCLGLDLNLCCKRKAEKTDIILEELFEPKKENSEFLKTNNNNELKNYHNLHKISNFDDNYFTKNKRIKNKNIFSDCKNSDSEEDLFEDHKTRTVKKEKNIQIREENQNKEKITIIESKHNFQIKIETTQRYQIRTNIIKINNNHLEINKNATNLELAKTNSSTNINKKLNIFKGEKNEIINSQITDNSIFNNNTTKMDTIQYSARKDQEIESTFNAEFEKSLNPIGKIEDKSISPILTKKQLNRKKLKKMLEIDSMRNNLKKWAF